MLSIIHHNEGVMFKCCDCEKEFETGKDGPVFRCDITLCSNCAYKPFWINKERQEVKPNIRHHEGKPRWDLLAYDTLREMSVVMTEGAAKHGLRDWEKGVSYNDYFSAAMRHLSAWHLGESVDGSGHNHLAHAMCNLMILFASELRQIGEDDRPKILPGDKHKTAITPGMIDARI